MPDLATAAVGLAAMRERPAPFETVGFPGWTLDGRALVAALERVGGRPLTVRPMPWWLLRLAAPFSADIHGVLSVRWLWERPHAIDGTRLAGLLPGFRSPDVDAGLTVALERLGASTISSPSESTAGRFDEHENGARARGPAGDRRHLWPLAVAVPVLRCKAFGATKRADPSAKSARQAADEGSPSRFFLSDQKIAVVRPL